MKNDTGHSTLEAFRDHCGCSVVGKNLIGLVQHCDKLFTCIKNIRQQASSNIQYHLLFRQFYTQRPHK